ncbi:MAG: 2OG-Fe(II) oxygenase [Gammaproteobacteria bacterium]|nr:2OG-Fe(II) oxygenase [Gammaproteobacteria bacterium]MDA8022959.1 2OG-Fe(II) oxygenase [Gammaproteobacteria bacterium]MDA8024478.1 2OG-Fe(II) oxygenase [Gammaproteobacteria bacterium]
MQRLITYDNAAAHGCWREVAADILVIPFWNTDFCADIIRAAELVDEFKPYGPDVKNNAAPGQEVRINRISPKFAENFEADFQARIAPVVRAHWWPLKLGKTRMPFVLRYSPDTQAALDPHHDAAMLSFAVPLNTGFDGGVLTFPRQHWDSRDVAPGDIIAFPSRVTHVHWVTPVTGGRRYALTCWLAAPGEAPQDPIVP